MLVAAAIVSLLVFWLPFFGRLSNVWGVNFGRKGMEVIASNFDGLNFLVVERSWYDPAKIEQINTMYLTGNDPIYFTAHYPAFALVVGMFDLVLTGPEAIFAAIILSNIMLAAALYYFYLELTGKKKTAFGLGLLALFLPARMLSVRAVASTEMLFIAATLGSLTLHMKGKKWQAAGLGALAVLTRSPGILLFLGYVISELLAKRKKMRETVKNLVPYLAIPAALVALWLYYGYKFGSVFAYFQSGDNLHLFFPPFQFFSNTQSWVNGMWLEDGIYIYLLFSFGVYRLYEKYKQSKYRAVISYAVVYLAVITLVAHRDLARYSLPLAPLALAGYEDILKSEKMRRILVILLIPIYLLGWNFVLQNTQPINDWSVFL